MGIDDTEHYFLKGGGEMGKLFRAKDWDKTPLGNPKDWPHSLRTVVAILLNNPFGMYISWGTEYTQLYNDAYRPILGTTKHPHALGTSSKETFREIWHTIGPMFDNVLKGNSVALPDFMLPLNRNGFIEECYFDLAYSPIIKIDGQVGGLLATITETTNKKRAEETLKSSEKQFRSLAETLPQLIFETDNKGNALYASGKWMEYSGINPKTEDSWKMIIHPDDLEDNNKKWEQSLETGETFKYDLRLKSKNGSYAWHRVIAEPIYEGTTLTKWVGAFTNINNEKNFTNELKIQVTERTQELAQSNSSLTKSEQRYQLLVEEVQDYAILYLDLQGEIKNWNKGAEKIKGYHANDIIGQHFSVFYTEFDRMDGLPESLLQEAMTTGRAVQEGWRVRKDKTLFWASVAITATHDPSNNVIGFSKVTHDLTEKKAASDKLELYAAQLEQKNKELEKMNKELESFAYISSHDLQEPLRKIQTFSSLILEKEFQNLSDSGKDKFERMQKCANRMQALIEDLLAYSRTNTKEKEYETVDLRKIVEDVKDDLKEELEHKQATVAIGNMCEGYVIPFQFRQLIHNLMGNSLKFSNNGRPPLIKIASNMATGLELGNRSLVAKNTYCHVRFSDNGIGFDPRHADKIFELFQRVHGNGQYNGTGIGLAIVKKIVFNHNGTITAKGEPGRGATFDIYLPMA